MRIPARAVNQQDGIGRVTGRVVSRLTEGYVVKSQIRERLARAEAEIANVKHAVADRPVSWLVVDGRRNLRIGKRDRGEQERSQALEHLVLRRDAQGLDDIRIGAEARRAELVSSTRQSLQSAHRPLTRARGPRPAVAP